MKSLISAVMQTFVTQAFVTIGNDKSLWEE